MKAKEIRDLIDFISETGLEEVNIETQEFKIKVKRTPNQAQSAVSAPAAPAPAPAPTPSAPAAAPAASESKPAAAPQSSADANTVAIKSPMIGTFYDSPNPDSPVFIKVGDTVKAGDTVCIVEAMKLFNEIESEVSGKVVKVLVENAQPVEFDQPLFLVEPA